MRTPPWLWPNLLSLDAPLIAVLWQGFLAQRYGVPLRIAGRADLFLTVWAIYIADRLLDARAPEDPAEPARHRFYRRHRRAASAILAVLLVAIAGITIFLLRPAVVRNGLLPLAAVVAYLALLNLSGKRRIAKEPVVAFVFTSGMFLVAWTNDPASPIGLLLPAVAFFVLCLANLCAIEKWEWEELRREVAPPQAMTRWLVRTLSWWAILPAAAALLDAGDPWYAAIGLGGACVAALVYSGRRIPIEGRRVLVDAAMLTPLLFLR